MTSESASFLGGFIVGVITTWFVMCFIAYGMLKTLDVVERKPNDRTDR